MDARPTIPEQESVSWPIAFVVCWAGLKRRLLRSCITTTGVVLAIALLAYMLTTDSLTRALAEAAVNDAALYLMLQQAGVDVYGRAGADPMMILLLGLSLLTCTVGIINSMLMAVTERVREIGTLKCLGARDSFIVRTYFIESALQGMLGAFTGMLAGFLVALAVSLKAYGTHTFTLFPVLAVTRALSVSCAAGAVISVLAAIAPAYAAARKEPVEALRLEE